MDKDIELEDIGWKTLQRRRINLEKLLHRAIRIAHERDGSVTLLDLALGSGRQVLEVLRSLPELSIDAELRDIDDGNLEKGRQLANQLGVTGLKFINADAFDTQALLTINPATNVALATGIFELTPDNNKVLGTLRGLAAKMQTGGFLVYTDQPHHPDLEMIGRKALSRGESPWVMRRRPDQEINQLIADAGFEELEHLSDNHALFRVGLARST